MRGLVGGKVVDPPHPIGHPSRGDFLLAEKLKHLLTQPKVDPLWRGGRRSGWVQCFSDRPTVEGQLPLTLAKSRAFSSKAADIASSLLSPASSAF